MNIADRIYEEVRRLPEPLTREVLDFIGYLEAKHGLSAGGLEDLKKAQGPVMEEIWDNPEDEDWNEW